MKKTKNKSKREPVQTGNVCTVVCTFRGVPCSINVYENDKEAVKAYNKAVSIHWDVLKQQQGYGGEMKEAFHDKRRVKTSCSGLPHCLFESDGYGIAVVRGPIYTVMPKKMPYIAVNYDDGRLQVVGFENYPEACGVYDRIKDSHKDDGIQEMREDTYHAFSTDEISVAIGLANVVPEGGECRLV